jgi:hypothetical protein
MRCLLFLGVALFSALAAAQEPAWTTWSASQAESIGAATFAKGRVGKRATMRLLKTERAISYKLAATWMTEEVIGASARLLQLRGRLAHADAIALAVEAEAVRDTVIMVDLDPDEGSGVIPLEWEALLQPKGEPGRAVPGTKMPNLREVRALSGVLRRNYDYDRFWLVFRLVGHDGAPLFRREDTDAELVVRIYDREGRVQWPIPSSIRTRSTLPN